MNKKYDMMNKMMIFVLISMAHIAVAQNEKSTFSHKIGAFEIILLSEGQQTGNTGILLGATPEMLAACIPNGTFPNATNAFLIKTPDKNVLVDTGYGKNLFENMKMFGITPEQIDIVLITHAHGDHIGGLLHDNAISFPNATIYFSQPEYDYWTSKKEMEQAPENKRDGFVKMNALAATYKDQIKLFQPADFEDKKSQLWPGISAIAAYGHTPGHTAFLIESEKDKMLIWGDLTHAMAIQMPFPEVAVTYDVDPDEAIVSRKKVLDYVSKHKIPIAGMHIAFPGMGTINQSGSGFVFTDF